MADATEAEFDLRSLDDAELVEQVHDDLYNGLKAEVEEATHIFLERGWEPDRRAERRPGRGHAHRRHRLPRRHPVRARGAARRQRHEGRHGDPAAAARRDRRRADRQDRDRHGQGRHPRHRQEPGRDDAGGRRLRGHRPRHQQPGREVPGRARGAQAGHPRHVGAADHDDALHEGRDRHAEGEGPARQVHRAGRRRAAQRGVRQGDRRRRLLPRRRGRRRDRQAVCCAERPGAAAAMHA